MKGWGRKTLTMLAVGLMLTVVSTTVLGEYTPPPVKYGVPQLKRVKTRWISGQLATPSTFPRNFEGVPVALEYLGSPPYRQITYTDGKGRFFFVRSLLAPKGLYRIHVLSPKGEWCQDVVFMDSAKASHFFNINCSPPDPKRKRH